MTAFRPYNRFAGCHGCGPPAQLGRLIFDGDLVSQFTETLVTLDTRIYGAQARVFEYFDGDDTSLEADILDRLAIKPSIVACRKTASGNVWTPCQIDSSWRALRRTAVRHG